MQLHRALRNTKTDSLGSGVRGIQLVPNAHAADSLQNVGGTTRHTTQPKCGQPASPTRPGLTRAVDLSICLNPELSAHQMQQPLRAAHHPTPSALPLR